MPNITGSATVGGINVYQSETVQSAPLGLRVAGSDGKEFRYVKAGASALVVGNVLQSPAYGTDHNALVVVSGTAGDYSVVVTLATAAVTKDQYAGGTMSINVTPGLGQSYTIVGHPAQASTTGNVTLTLAEPLRTTLSTATRVALKKCAYNGVIQSPVTTLTGSTVGIAVYAIPSGEYGWIQVKGLCSCLSDNSSIIMGSAVEVSLTVAGSIALAGTAAVWPIGIACQAKDSTKVIVCDIMVL